MEATIVDKVVEQLKTLPQELQWRVLEFTRALSLSTPHGIAGKELLPLLVGISHDDLAAMRLAIEQDCENVDSNGW